MPLPGLEFPNERHELGNEFDSNVVPPEESCVSSPCPLSRGNASMTGMT